MIRCAKDITDSSIQEMLREHFNDRTLNVHLEEDGLKVLGTNCNDYCNSDMKRLTCSIVRNGGEEEKLHMIVKLPIMGPTRHFHKISRPFMREVIWYAQALPALQEFSNALADLVPLVYRGYSVHSKSVLAPPLCERLCCLPCWLPFREIDGGVLILDDLTKSASGKAYSCVDKHKVMGLAHVTMALRALAHFHGAWWRFLRHNKDESGKITAKDALAVFQLHLPEFVIRSLINRTFKSIVQLLRNRGESEELISKVQWYAKEKAVQQLLMDVKTPEADNSKLVTMLHSDFWSNNMMFEHNSEGNPVDIKLIDFQMLTRGHPSFDISYLLYINTDSEFRAQHLQTVLREYFGVFSSYLDQDLKVTFESFEKEFQERRHSGLVLGLMSMPNVTSPNHAELKTMGDFKNLNRKIHREIAGPDTEDTHPAIKEIRRKIIGTIHECEKIGMF